MILKAVEILFGVLLFIYVAMAIFLNVRAWWRKGAINVKQDVIFPPTGFFVALVVFYFALGAWLNIADWSRRGLIEAWLRQWIPVVLEGVGVLLAVFLAFGMFLGVWNWWNSRARP